MGVEVWKTVQIQRPTNGRSSRNHGSVWGTMGVTQNILKLSNAWESPRGPAVTKSLWLCRRTCHTEDGLLLDNHALLPFLPHDWMKLGLEEFTECLAKHKEDCFRPSCVWVCWRTGNKIFWQKFISHSSGCQQIQILMGVRFLCLPMVKEIE